MQKDACDFVLKAKEDFPARLTFKNRDFHLTFKDENHREPHRLFLLEKDEEIALCEFYTAKKIKRARPDYNFKKEFDVDQLCENIARRRDVDYLTPLPIEPVDIDMNLSAREEIAVDLDDDGIDEPLYYVQYAALAGEGQGCAFHYFLLKEDIHPEGSEDKPLSPLGNRLYWAQHGRPEDKEGKNPPHLCEGLQDTRLITFENRLFLERGDLAREAANASQLYHQVWYFKDDQSYEMCHFEVKPRRTYRLVDLPY